MTTGFVLHDDGWTRDHAPSLDGYSVIQAEDGGEALELIGDHPFPALGSEYAVGVFEPLKRYGTTLKGRTT